MTFNEMISLDCVLLMMELNLCLMCDFVISLGFFLFVSILKNRERERERDDVINVPLVK